MSKPRILITMPMIELVELAKIVSEMDGDSTLDQRKMLAEDAHHIIEQALGVHAQEAYAEES